MTVLLWFITKNMKKKQESKIQILILVRSKYSYVKQKGFAE